MKKINYLLFLAIFFLVFQLKLASQNVVVPSSWEVNVNGYKGDLVIQQYDGNTKEVEGTILGTKFKGFLNDRHLIFYRSGTEQMYDGWILDPKLGAHGQPYYDGNLVISGLVSEGKSPVDGVYPWYAVMKVSQGPMANTGINHLSPGLWVGHKNGQAAFNISNNDLCIESMKPGGAWFSTKRMYSIDQDYTVDFDVKLGTTDNHFPILYSDGFVFVDIDWGTDLGHVQPGASYGLKSGLGRLEVNKWHHIKVMAHPSKGTFDLYLDDKKVSTASGIKFPLEYHTNVTNTKLQSDNEDIWLGDADDVSHLGGNYNRGLVCWRNIRVTGQVFQSNQGYLK